MAILVTGQLSSRMLGRESCVSMSSDKIEFAFKDLFIFNFMYMVV